MRIQHGWLFLIKPLYTWEVFLSSLSATAVAKISALLKKLPLFYIRTLQYWFEFKDMQDNTKPGIKNTIIWNNKDIKIDNNTIFFRS